MCNGACLPTAAALDPSSHPSLLSLQIQVELQQLTKRLAAINESLARKIDTNNEYDKVRRGCTESEVEHGPLC